VSGVHHTGRADDSCPALLDPDARAHGRRPRPEVSMIVVALTETYLLAAVSGVVVGYL
jgi:hypothetical protein